MLKWNSTVFETQVAFIYDKYHYHQPLTTYSYALIEKCKHIFLYVSIQKHNHRVQLMLVCMLLHCSDHVHVLYSYVIKYLYLFCGHIWATSQKCSHECCCHSNTGRINPPQQGHFWVVIQGSLGNPLYTALIGLLWSHGTIRGVSQKCPRWKKLNKSWLCHLSSFY